MVTIAAIAEASARTDGIPLRLTVNSEMIGRQFDLRRGQIVVPVGSGAVNLEV